MNRLLLWDRGTIPRRKAVKQWITAHPRLHVEEFPAYAPDLNPAEYVWAQADRAWPTVLPWTWGSWMECSAPLWAAFVSRNVFSGPASTPLISHGYS